MVSRGKRMVASINNNPKAHVAAASSRKPKPRAASSSTSPVMPTTSSIIHKTQSRTSSRTASQVAKSVITKKAKVYVEESDFEKEMDSDGDEYKPPSEVDSLEDLENDEDLEEEEEEEDDNDVLLEDNSESESDDDDGSDEDGASAKAKAGYGAAEAADRASRAQAGQGPTSPPSSGPDGTQAGAADATATLARAVMKMADQLPTAVATAVAEQLGPLLSRAQQPMPPPDLPRSAGGPGPFDPMHRMSFGRHRQTVLKAMRRAFIVPTSSNMSYLNHKIDFITATAVAMAALNIPPAQTHLSECHVQPASPTTHSLIVSLSPWPQCADSRPRSTRSSAMCTHTSARRFASTPSRSSRASPTASSPSAPSSAVL